MPRTDRQTGAEVAVARRLRATVGVGRPRRPRAGAKGPRRVRGVRTDDQLQSRGRAVLCLRATGEDHGALRYRDRGARGGGSGLDRVGCAGGRQGEAGADRLRQAALRRGRRGDGSQGLRHRPGQVQGGVSVCARAAPVHLQHRCGRRGRRRLLHGADVLHDVPRSGARAPRAQQRAQDRRAPRRGVPRGAAERGGDHPGRRQEEEGTRRPGGRRHSARSVRSGGKGGRDVQGGRVEKRRRATLQAHRRREGAPSQAHAQALRQPRHDAQAARRGR